MATLPDSVSNVIAACEGAKRCGAARIEVRFGKYGIGVRTSFPNQRASFSLIADDVQKTMEAHGYKLNRGGFYEWVK